MTGTWAAHLVEQKLIQKFELVGVGDLAEHGLPPLLGHRDLADLAISILLSFEGLLACSMAVLLARRSYGDMGQPEARSDMGTQVHTRSTATTLRSGPRSGRRAAGTRQLCAQPAGGSWKLRGTNLPDSSWWGLPVGLVLHCPLSPPCPPDWASYPWLCAGRAA